jgi:hypothetical protein
MFRRYETWSLKLHTIVRIAVAVVAFSVCITGYASSTSSTTSQLPAASDDALQVDATPAGILPSSQYTVRIRRGDRSVNSFVYQVQNPGFLPNNGDGAKDLLLWDADTSQNTIWYTNFDGGAYYQTGPTLQPSLLPGWQVTP